MELETVRNDLREMKYYFSRKKEFDNASSSLSENLLVNKITKYNEAIKKAPVRLYDIFYNLYILGNSFDSLSLQMHFSYSYIQKLNRKVVQFLAENIKEGDEAYV